MAGLRDTVASLLRGRRRFAVARPAVVGNGRTHARPRNHELLEVTGFGTNPGNLRMLTFVPEGPGKGSPLVVVLHGCTQNAGYARAVGWIDLAAELGFAVLVPEQRAANNPNTCFNWFQRADTQRDSGETFSIWEMVERMVVDHGLDRRRVYVTGLSAGGAMACAMLATYPDVFAAGAIVAGLPYRSADGVQQALIAMRQPRPGSARSWGDLVRAASLHRGPWPRVSVWHGKQDNIVAPSNADGIAQQWCDVHGLADAAFVQDTLDGQTHRSWLDAWGRPVVETIMVDGLAHGTPIDAEGAAGEPLGTPAPFVIDIGIGSTRRIAARWGLDNAAVPLRTRSATAAAVPRENAAGGVLEGAAQGALTALRKILPRGVLAPKSAQAEVSAGEWQEQKPSDDGGAPVYCGYASSGIACVGGLHTKTMSRTIRVEAGQRLTYERRLHLHAGVNILTKAVFRVTVDGETIDKDAVVFANRMDHDWTARSIDLSRHTGREVEVCFEVAADCNVCIEVFAKAWVRGLRIDAAERGSSASAEVVEAAQ